MLTKSELWLCSGSWWLWIPAGPSERAGELARLDRTLWQRVVAEAVQ